MPRLVLTFDNRVVNEYALDAVVTIGRLPDNMLVIDNPAVSGHHARILLEGDHYVVEDLRSKNGTFVNEQDVVRARLQNGDVLLVGKHKLVFDETADAECMVARLTLPTPGKTAYLDTKNQRALLAKLREERARKRDQADAEAKGSRSCDDC
jgi:pSer/pThr/pTyr-binding forkhead associated (FHA) protein